jgi:hypothetical protein
MEEGEGVSTQENPVLIPVLFYISILQAIRCSSSLRSSPIAVPHIIHHPPSSLRQRNRSKGCDFFFVLRTTLTPFFCPGNEGMRGYAESHVRNRMWLWYSGKLHIILIGARMDEDALLKPVVISPRPASKRERGSPQINSGSKNRCPF